MKTILVTGGLGFIGTNIIHLLLNKFSDYRVINLDAVTYAGNPKNLKELENDSRYSFVHGEIGNRTLIDALLTQEKPEVIVNFAAESHVDRSLTGPAAVTRSPRVTAASETTRMPPVRQRTRERRD